MNFAPGVSCFSTCCVANRIHVYLTQPLPCVFTSRSSVPAMATTGASSSTEYLISEMRILDKKFRRACRQIVLLNNKLEGLQVRYDRAYKVNRRSFRYSIRLQLATLEGMRNMFYEYACRRADELEALQDQLVDAGVMSDTEEDIDWDEVQEEY